MTDLLVQRLKSAKRELTALKTAHKRGLGLLKIYRYEYKLADLGIRDVYLTTRNAKITYSSQFPPYPLTRFAADIIGNTSFGKSAAVNKFIYTNGGYNAVLDMTIYRNDANGLTKFVVYSTAPIVSLILEEK